MGLTGRAAVLRPSQSLVFQRNTTSVTAWIDNSLSCLKTRPAERPFCHDFRTTGRTGRRQKRIQNKTCAASKKLWHLNAAAA
ncbi:hypothetical protein AA3990_0201 [Gluconobacter roseus NBRC 3990]|nr:hypothetical protein AA3990_0201 [Gluconobacter roseus NBRC 3990]